MLLRKRLENVCVSTFKIFKFVFNVLNCGLPRLGGMSSITSLAFYFSFLTIFFASIVTPSKGLSTTKNKSTEVSDSDLFISITVDVEDDNRENMLMENIEVPRVQELRKRKNKNRRGKNRKCKKTFCFNNGKCHWIKELKQATCRCKAGFKGERCQFLDIIEFTKQEKERDTTIAIAVVVSAFVLIGLLTVTCVCWRRFKHVRDHLEVTTLEVDEKKGMIEEQPFKQSNTSLPEKNDDRESVV